MSAKLLKQSMDIIQEDLKTTKRIKKGKPTLRNKINRSHLCVQPQKKSIQDVQKELATKGNKSEENIKRLLALSMNTVKVKDAEKDPPSSPLADIGLDHSVIQTKIENREYQLQAKRGRSRVWDIFSYIINEKGEVVPGYVSCKYCWRVLKYSSKSTSNLIKHKCYVRMHITHQTIAAVGEDTQTRRTLRNVKKKSSDEVHNKAATSSSSNVSDLDPNVIKSKVASGEYKIQPKKGRSKVWQIFSHIINEKGEMIMDYVFCENCSKVFKYNTYSTSNLVKHKCYMNNNQLAAMVDVDSKTRLRTSIVCTRWIVENCRPFNIVQDKGFHKVIKEALKIGAKFGANVNLSSLLPRPTTINRNIDKLYNNHFATIKTAISEIKEVGFALTSELWTDNYLEKSFIALTIHYISNGNMCSKLLSMLSMEGGKSIDENILREVSNSLQLYGCELDDKSAIVTAPESNMVAAFEAHNHVFCIAHLLHNVLEKSMTVVKVVEELCRRCTQLVKYFKITGLNSPFKTLLKSYSPTRWNSVYNVFSLIETNWSDIMRVLKDRNELHRINDIQFKHITEIISILQPFQEAFDKLEGEKYPTIHLVYIYAHYLKKKCNNGPLDSEFTTQFKNQILENIDEILFRNLKPIHKLAIFLFPPTKKMLQFNYTEKENVRLECKRIMECYIDLLPLRSAQERPKLNSDEPMFDFVDHIKKETPVDEISIEINTYENMSINHSEDFSVLQWWELHKKEFPLLYYTSCKVLCTPATSAASERIFSQARKLISEKRCNIASNHESINKIMFLHCNIEESNLKIDDLQ